MEYAICFYEEGKVEFFKGDGSSGTKVEYSPGSLLKVNEEEMFRWLEKAHNEKVLLSIYRINLMCDLS